jgi:hypothetical protein
MQTKEVKAFGAQAADRQLERLAINRRIAAPPDVEIEILYWKTGVGKQQEQLVLFGSILLFVMYFRCERKLD